jgi:hypothetical protein
VEKLFQATFRPLPRKLRAENQQIQMFAEIDHRSAGYQSKSAGGINKTDCSACRRKRNTLRDTPIIYEKH